MTKQTSGAETRLPAFPAVFAEALDYTIDGFQRGVLFCDAMRQRGNQYREQVRKGGAARPVLRGRTRR